MRRALISGHGPTDGGDGHAQNRGALGLTPTGRQQPLQPPEPFPAQLRRVPAPPAPLAKLGLAMCLGSGDSPIRAISVTVIGFSLSGADGWAGLVKTRLAIVFGGG